MVEPVVLTPEQQNRKLVIPFYTAIGANANITLVSSKITHMYKITRIEAHFREDTLNNVQVRVYSSTNRNAPTANPPTGTNLISKFSNTPYIVGQGQTVVANCFYIPSFQEVFIKVYITNNNAVAMTQMVLITIESITIDEAKRLIPAEKWEEIVKEPVGYWEELDRRGQALYYQLLDSLAGSPIWISRPDLEESIYAGTLRKNIVLGAQKTGNYFKYIKTDATDKEKAEAYHKWFADAFELVKEYTLGNAIVEIASLGQLDFQRDLIEIDKQIYQTFQIMGKVQTMSFEKAWLAALERQANRTWLPTRPTIDQMINMVVKEKLTVKEFIHWMKDLGFNEYWSQTIWDAHFRAPDFTEVRQAIWREGIKHDDIVNYLKRVDLDPFYNEEVWFKLLYQIPPYTDLINMRVKEVIDQPTFEKAIQGHGFYDPWAARLWDAHFAPPTFSDFLTAMRRKQAVSIPLADGTTKEHTFGVDLDEDIKVINELSILTDYDPRYWSFFKQRIYEDPTARQARWGFETGAIDEEQVRDIVKRAGLTDTDAEWFTQMLVTFQERPFITRYLNGLMAGYIQGAISEEELKKRVTEIPRREAVAEWIIKIADLRKEVAAKTGRKEKEKLLSLGELKRMYSSELITEEDFRTRLLSLGYELLDIQLLIDLIQKVKEETETGAAKRALTTAEMFNAFKWWQITEEELRTNLMLRGLTLAEADLLINTKKTQWITKEGWTTEKPA